jgi:hypothetical protein
MSIDSVPQFWHVTYYVDGMGWQEIGESESDARIRASDASVRHGSAIVTNREGWVATYVSGKPWSAVKR